MCYKQEDDLACTKKCSKVIIDQLNDDRFLVSFPQTGKNGGTRSKSQHKSKSYKRFADENSELSEEIGVTKRDESTIATALKVPNSSSRK
mmetsp:Transcript_11695/g.13277  ORF Transcript_11695/g.13277 Transcript_11695/m.13277 type:complete len:90 (+) Transcript_11695:30-299(+)